MKCIRPFLLTFLSALVMAPGVSFAQSSPPVATTAPVLLGAEFHPGETVRYTFSLKMNLTSRVDSRFATAQPSITPRQYQVDGEIVATFAPTQPGEPLHATVQFQGLTVKNWVSSAQVADFEARLRQFEAALLTLTTAADGNLELSKRPADPLHDPYAIDTEDLDSLARAVLTLRISSQPLSPGQRRESADFPIHGMVDPGTKVSILTEYVTDVPIARHPNAEVRLSVDAPNQPLPDSYGFKSLKSEELQLQMRRKFHGADVLTYLLDLNIHQINFLHDTGRGGVDITIESTDTNAEVRIPLKVITLNVEDEETVRRVAASAPPEREADLAAFEKSLQASPPAASEGSEAATTASPGGEVSLGDLARRQRAARAAQSPPQAETALQGTAQTAEGVPTGFKQETFPSGEMTVSVPAQAIEVQRTSDNLVLRADVGTPPTAVAIALTEAKVGEARSPDDQLNEVAQELSAGQALRALRSEKTRINGEPALVAEIVLTVQGKPFHGLQAFVISGGKGFVLTCEAPAADFPKIESTCRTVADSLRAR